MRKLQCVWDQNGLTEHIRKICIKIIKNDVNQNNRWLISEIQPLRDGTKMVPCCILLLVPYSYYTKEIRYAK